LRHLLYLMIFSMFFAACGQSSKSELKSFQVSEQQFSSYINPRNLSEANLQEDQHIVNRDYPIELALYQDGSFYYNLPNLGDGKGSWKFVKGRIQLFAKRNLFDMYIDVFSRNENASELGISFSDRFGPKVLPVEVVNPGP
jgi:hypothetical protein